MYHLKIILILNGNLFLIYELENCIEDSCILRNYITTIRFEYSFTSTLQI